MRFGRYEITETLHSDGPYLVCRGTDGDAKVILKILREDAVAPQRVEALRHGYALMRRIDHPGVANALAFEWVGDQPALIMKDAGGRTLAERLAQGLPPLGEALRIGIAAAEALEAIHAANIVHGDPTPKNLVCGSDARDVVVIDFGLATRSGVGGPVESGLRGTPAYVAPELTGRLRLRPDHRADLYTLGAVLYEMLAGERPFPGGDVLHLVHAHLALTPPSLAERRPDAPAQLVELVARLLAKRPEERYQTAAGLAADLRRCLALVEGTGSAFEVGADDTPRRFSLSEGLHGRVEARERLREALERLVRGAPGGETLEVAGPPGAGKSALVASILPEFDRVGAIVAEMRAAPDAEGGFRAGLAGALRRVAELLMTGRYGDIDAWRERLDAAVGEGFGALAEIAPEVRWLSAGRLEPPARLGPQETATRLVLAVRRFLRACASGDAPLALVVEDVQNADPALREILDGLARPQGPERMLVILTRRIERDAELADRPGLVTLSELSERDIADLLAATLHRPTAETRPLAAAIRRKVGGNPLAVRQFAGSLADAGVIRFDPAQKRWVWDLAAVHAREASDDLAALLVARGEGLPETDRLALCAAACVGGDFEVEEVAAGAGLDGETAEQALERAVDMDWLSPVLPPMGLGAEAERTPRLQFVHERIRHAAAGMGDAAQRRGIHARLAERAAQDDAPEAADRLARHLHAALPPEADEPTVARARNACAAAGAQAMAAGDRARAHLRFSAAADLLGPEDWRDAPAASFELMLAAGSAALLAGRFAEMDSRLDACLDAAAEPAARARVHGLRIFGLMARDRTKEAVETGLGALKELGDPLPEEIGPAQIGEEVGAVFATLGDRPVESLEELEECRDPRAQAVQALLAATTYPAFSAAPMVFAAAAARLTARAMRDGLTEHSVVGFNDFGLLACGSLDEIELGRGFALQARRLVETRGLEAERARVDTVFNAFIRHRTEPIRDTLPGLEAAARTGLGAGDVHSASLAAFDRAFQIFWIGERVDAAEAAFAEAAEFCEDLDVGMIPDLIRLYRQTLVGFRSAPTEPERLSGDFAEGEDLLKSYGGRDPNGLAQLHIVQALLCRVHGDRTGAMRQARAAAGFLQGIPSTPAVPAYHALFAMAVNPPEAGAGPDPSDFEAMQRGAEATGLWARHAPDNYGHYAQAAAAELSLARGEDADWFDGMDRAAEEAARNGFTRDAAMFLERIAEVSRARGREGRANRYHQAAWRAWVRYGADAKVAELAHEQDVAGARPAPGPQEDGVLGAVSVSLSGETLDLGGLLKATRAISQEVTVADLLRALLAGIVETSGAQRAIVAAPDGEDFGVVAEITAGPAGPAFAAQPDPTAARRCGAEDAPLSALRLVARTRRAVFADDSTSDARLSGDPYFQGRRMAVAAIPIERGAELIGIAYLENRSVAQAFSAGRLDILRALCAQAAISWDNARLYDRQTELLKAADRFVPTELFRLFSRSEITDVTLGDCVEQRMTLLVSDLRNSSGQAERLGPERTFVKLNEYLGIISSIVRAHDGLILKYVGDGVLALFPGGTDPALAAAVKIQEVMRSRAAEGEGSISAGIALHAGEVMLGAVGDEERLQIDALSDAVNTAFRLEDMTKRYGARVIASRAALESLPEKHGWRFRRLGAAEIPGRARMEELLELLDAEAEDVRAAKIETIETFDAGLRLFEQRDFVRACVQLNEVLARNAADAAASRLFHIAAAEMSKLHDAGRG